MTRTALLLPVLLLATAVASPGRRISGHACIDKARLAAPYARDDGGLFFRGSPDAARSYVAVFKGGACPGLDRFSAVAIDSPSAPYCEGDRFRVFHPPTAAAGAVCVLDHLEPTTDTGGG